LSVIESQRNRAQLGLLSVILVSVYVLALSMALINADAFRLYCALADSNPVAAAAEAALVFGPAATMLFGELRVLKDARVQERQQAGLHRAVPALGLGYIVLHLATLRVPWLLGQAGATDRVTLWTARLSCTVAGVPLMAFAHALGLSLFLYSVSASALGALETAGYLALPKCARLARVTVWSTCVLVYAIGLATLVSFAAGGTI
jgi:hypothetical protein